jgi:hypothetical protein
MPPLERLSNQAKRKLSTANSTNIPSGTRFIPSGTRFIDPSDFVAQAPLASREKIPITINSMSRPLIRSGGILGSREQNVPRQ